MGTLCKESARVWIFGTGSTHTSAIYYRWVRTVWEFFAKLLMYSLYELLLGLVVHGGIRENELGKISLTDTSIHLVEIVELVKKNLAIKMLQSFHSLYTVMLICVVVLWNGGTSSLLTSSLRISRRRLSWNSRKVSIVNLLSRFGPKKWSTKASPTEPATLPVVLRSLWRWPTDVALSTTFLTLSNSSTSTSPSPFKSNILKAISKWWLGAEKGYKSTDTQVYTHWAEFYLRGTTAKCTTVYSIKARVKLDADCMQF